MKKKLSLRLQIVGLLLCFVCLMLGLIFLFQTVFLNRFYLSEKISTMKEASERIAESLGRPHLEQTVQDLMATNEVCVRIVYDDISLVGYSPNNACALVNLDDDLLNVVYKQVKDAGGSRLIQDFKYHALSDHAYDVYIYGQMAKQRGKDVLILVSSIITPLSATVSTLRAQYGGIAAIVVLMALVLAFFISRIVLRPITQILNEIEHLPKGEYQPEHVNAYSKETRELNDSLALANEKIQIADKAKKDLIANVSHDLRTPLTMIIGYGEMIRDFPEDDNSENVDVIISEAKRLNLLVNDLLDLSAMQSGGMSISPVSTSVRSILEPIYHALSPYCLEKGIDLALDLEADVSFIADEKRLSQVVYNFVYNAIAHNSKAEKKIIMGAKIVSGKLRIYVFDNGDGIRKEDLPYVWDRFYKVDKEHRRASEGSGIGLAVCAEILKKHGLVYDVESALGDHSCFFFEIENYNK